MLYITSTRLMRLSENSVREHASSGEEIPRRVCSQLLANEPRYGEWHARHEAKMRSVASQRLRDPQVMALRTVAVEQVHRTALVAYLRRGVTGAARERALGLFYGLSDARDATLAEHRSYLIAASTQVCAHDLLELVGDHEGLDLVRQYEIAYGQYFAMFCERAVALQMGQNYLLSALLPEVKDAAERLRRRILRSKVRATDSRPSGAGAHKPFPARTPARAAKRPGLDHLDPRSAAPPAGRSARSRTAR